jgi:predicted nucleic acid-binding protein
MFLAAQLIHVRYLVSHWDSLILAAARETNSAIVYSEGFRHGQDYDGTKVVNPFL